MGMPVVQQVSNRDHKRLKMFSSAVVKTNEDSQLFLDYLLETKELNNQERAGVEQLKLHIQNMSDFFNRI